ncbi:SAM-dependent methyltransferase [Priestia koreensis]|uniref:SAM-dependent methyltransferase n=1 Tax=Priestia koreensis TaxID=284581 RepID=UPI003457826B
MGAMLEIDRIVFIGRTFQEYTSMFNLKRTDLQGKMILDCASGACSFTAHANKIGATAMACDVAYEFDTEILAKKGLEDIDHTMDKMRDVSDQYDWSYFQDVKGLKKERTKAFYDCMQDMRIHPYRYLYGKLPHLPFQDKQFDLTLSAHLLFMYDDRLDYQFHLQSLKELIRVTRSEIRLFSLSNRSGRRSRFVDQLKEDLLPEVGAIEEQEVTYKFQRGAQTMMRIIL